MAQNRVVNKGTKGGYATGIYTSGGYVAIGSTNAVVAANTAGETVSEMFISSVSWSAANNVVYTVARGANTVLNLSGSGHFNFQKEGVILETGGESAANCIITKNGAGVTSLVIKLHKRSAITGGSSY